MCLITSSPPFLLLLITGGISFYVLFLLPDLLFLRLNFSQMLTYALLMKQILELFFADRLFSWRSIFCNPLCLAVDVFSIDCLIPNLFRLPLHAFIRLLLLSKPPFETVRSGACLNTPSKVISATILHSCPTPTALVVQLLQALAYGKVITVLMMTILHNAEYLMKKIDKYQHQNKHEFAYGERRSIKPHPHLSSPSPRT